MARSNPIWTIGTVALASARRIAGSSTSVTSGMIAPTPTIAALVPPRPIRIGTTSEPSDRPSMSTLSITPKMRPSTAGVPVR